MATHHEIHLEGSFQVVILPDGTYEARIRMSGSFSLRIGTGSTPREALGAALD